MSLERVRNEHRRWLTRHGLLYRPWFVLASAPEPTIPSDITRHAAIICVNNAGLTATRIGLPSAELTISSRHKDWTPAEHLSLPLLLWVTNDTLWMYLRKRLKIAVVSRKQFETRRHLRKTVRRGIEASLLGDEIQRIGKKHKPSTGIFAVLYGIFVGVPEIILSGFSIDTEGYSYGSLPGLQLHRDEDRFAMRMMASCYPSVRTTEIEVAKRTGIPLYRMR